MLLVKTIEEFTSEMRALRKEMHAKGEGADAKLVASWVSKLAVALEGLGEALATMSEELDELAESEG